MFDTPNSDLPPLQSEEFLPPISRWATVGGLLLVGTLGGILALASVIKYNVTVIAPASVRPAGELSIVQAGAEGTVSNVKVQQNQTVQQGDIIAEINVFDRNRLRSLQVRQTTLQNYIRQYKGQLVNVTNQLQSLEAQIVAQSGIMPPPTTVRSVPVDQSSWPAEAAVEVALEALAQVSPIAATDLANQRDRLLQQRLSLQNQIRYDEESLQDVTTEIGKQVVRAPADGTILKLDIHHAGQTVRVGDPIAQIVPQNAPLVIKARVAVQDISHVALGQPVQLRISAYPYPDFGVLKGTVTAIAPDVTALRDTNGNALNFYEVAIQPAHPYLTKDKRQYPIQPGMEVRADIISRQETVFQLFLRQTRLWADL